MTDRSSSRLLVELSDASGLPFYRQIVDQLAELIRSGRLSPGSRLPSVRDLAGQLMVSLITTRRAYADLEAAGLIVIVLENTPGNRHASVHLARRGRPVVLFTSIGPGAGRGGAAVIPAGIDR